MEILTSFVIPAIAFYLMLVVGQSLELDDFLRVYEYPKQVIFATIGPLLLLPLTAAIIIILVKPSFSLAMGMILIAACPAGIISNFYCYLAKTNAALSITLTAVSSLAAIITLPLILGAGMIFLSDNQQEIHVPVRQIIMQLIVMLLLPIALGMWLRHRYTELICSYNNMFQRSSIFLVAALISLIFYNQSDQFSGQIYQVILLSLLFTAILIGLTWLLSLLFKSLKRNRIVLFIEFPVRNLALAAVISVNIFETSDYVVFGAVMFLTQLPVIGLIILYSRKNSVVINSN
jgi:BASS family bile acid:Na+ symporter